MRLRLKWKGREIGRRDRWRLSCHEGGDWMF